MKTFVIGDIHGRYNALMEVIEKSSFDPEEDKLICLGDVCDGGMQTYHVIEYLRKLPNLVYIWGNHDGEWFRDYLRTGVELPIWTHQGGIDTLYSYRLHNDEIIPESHKEFIDSGVPYHIETIDGKKSIFVHGGFDPHRPIEEQNYHELVWDRQLISFAKENWISEYDQVFVGHTTTEAFGSFEPIKFHNLWMLDTGAGWRGRLTIMDVTTKGFWQSKEQVPQCDCFPSKKIH
jgi:Calcineurin-like phosphoesterase.